MPMICTSCGKPVVLIPSASERAKKSDQTPAYYTALFPKHAECVIRERDEAVRKLMRR